MHWLTWIGILVIGIGTALTIIGQQKVNDKSNDLLQAKSNKIEELSQVNLKLSEINSELLRQSLNQITGSDSWAYVSSGLHTLQGIPNQPFMMNLNHIGDYPLYDLKIEIFEIEFSKDANPKSQTLTKVFGKEVGTLNKSMHPESLGIIELPNKKRVDYLIKLKAKSRTITQHWIFIKKEDNYWSTAQKIFKFKPNKDGSFSIIELLQRIDADFPEKNISWIEIGV
jgi:hypothetical protein